MYAAGVSGLAGTAHVRAFNLVRSVQRNSDASKANSSMYGECSAHKAYAETSGGKGARTFAGRMYVAAAVALCVFKIRHLDGFRKAHRRCTKGRSVVQKVYRRSWRVEGVFARVYRRLPRIYIYTVVERAFRV